MSRSLLIALVLSMVACDSGKGDGTDGTVGGVDSGTTVVDNDNDGYSSSEDCDDTDGTVHPGATEICDGIDNNCDGQVDEDVSSTYYRDADGDGFGDPDNSTEACENPSGYVPNANDCDDASADAYPGNEEVCDGIDNDCNGEIDEGVSTTWYADTDLDGYGDPESAVQACTQPTGYVEDDSDCDDTTAQAFPGNLEICDEIDNNCDGTVDEGVTTTYYADVDTDGFGNPAVTQEACSLPAGYSDHAGDCDDGEVAVNPDADEECDGIDNDCDGNVDEPDSLDASDWYADSDSDGYGDAAHSRHQCYQPTGYVTDATDCDDANATTYPGADEYCDGEDDDCDGDIDEDDSVDVSTWYADADSDSYGDAATSDIDCYQPTGYVADNTDCDDTNATTYPGADEYCDGEDDDCDGTIDEDDAVDVSTWYADADSDSYGDAATSDIDCYQPTGYVADNTDCDDTNATTYPGADEYCDGEDDDCDGTIDEDDAVDVSTWYADSDSDGYGDAATSDIDCYQPTGYVSDDTDCDDTNATTYPGADEYCDGEDDDCDGTIDEDDAVDVSTWYADSDSDGYGDAATSDIDCYQPTGYVADDTDCDDDNSTTYPGADEYCDGEDDDCDGTIDEDDAVDVSTWYADSDSDSYGDSSVSDIDCYQPTGYVADDTDCDDSDSSTYPGADEYCDGEDDDCDGVIDEDDAVDVSTWYADSDSDGYGDSATSDIDCYQPTGYVADDTDCDDANSAIYPGADEYCDGEDDDCDGDIDEDDAVDVSTWYQDYDSDSYGNASVSDTDCYQPSGYVSDDSDCDDADDAQYPGADEVCNGEDDDCDGDVDEDGEVTDGDTYYADDDGDSLGDVDDTIQACSAPSGYVDNYYDCDDANASEPVVVDAASGSASGAGTYDQPYDSIQDGIDNAAECVIVYSGTYREAIDVDKSIDIWGVEGLDYTNIDADGTTCSSSSPTGCEPAVTMAVGGASPSIHGFTVTGGTGYTTTTSTSTTCADSSSSHGGDNTCTVTIYEYCGGGFYINGDDPSLYDLVIEDNNLPEFEQTAVGDFTQYWLYSYGGGICAQDAVVDMENVSLYTNFADQGGGIFAEDAASFTIEQSVISENTAGDGAGFNLTDASSISANNAIFGCNDADTDGGGLFMSDSGTSASLTNMVFYKDTSSTGSTHGAGIYGDSSASVTMMNSIIYTSIQAYGGYGGGSGSFTYSDVYNSASGSYTLGGSWSAGTGGISSDPDFSGVSCDGNPLNDDYSLASTSPAIDAGNSSSSYFDTDGSRNDMGAYGGPSGDW